MTLRKKAKCGLTDTTPIEPNQPQANTKVVVSTRVQEAIRRRQRAIEDFLRPIPIWAKACGGYFFVLLFIILVSAANLARSERRFVAAFAESFVALCFILAAPYLAIVVGIIAGVWVGRRFSRKWLGWTVGVIIAFSTLGLSEWMGTQVNGVSWRIKKIRASASE